MVDITDRVQNIIDEARPNNGVAFLFVPGSTGALTTIEYEPGLTSDFPAALDRLVPKGIPYEHEKRWHDGNGHSHVRAALVGPSLTIPFKDSKLLLGTWQQIVIMEMDVRQRERKIILQIMGE